MIAGLRNSHADPLGSSDGSNPGGVRQSGHEAACASGGTRIPIAIVSLA
jgi:hypothetical protein